MLSVFPEILFLSPFALLLIRVAAAGVFAYADWRHVREQGVVPRVLAATEFAVALALFLGAWTQPAALVGTVVCGIWLARPSTRVVPLSTALLTLVMTLSLLITGPGALAFDLPL